MNEEEQQQSQGHVRKPSVAKSIVAKQKVRDEYGHFVSGEEAQAVSVRRQQMEFQRERDKFNSVLGRQTQMQPQINNPVPVQQPFNAQPFNAQQYAVPQNNFQNILNANKPGSNEDMKRWASLLGKDNISKNKKKDRWRI